MQGGGAKANNHACGRCGKEGTNLRCKDCLVVYYCDRDCQKAGWKLHKPICRLSSTTKKEDAPEKLKAEPVSRAKAMAPKAVGKSNPVSKTKSASKARLDDILLLRSLRIEDMLCSLFVDRLLEDDDYFFQGEDYDYHDYDEDDEDDDDEEEDDESPDSGLAPGGTNSNGILGRGVAQAVNTDESLDVGVAHSATNTGESLGVAHGSTNINAWHEGISKEQVYVRLIDSFRLQRDVEYTQCGDVCEFYGGGSPMPGFKRYTAKAKAKKVLPKWWSPEHTSKVKNTAETHDWANINHAVEKHDIVDHYVSLNKPFEVIILRRLAAEIDGPINNF